MSNFPCKIIEADLAADIVTLQMEGDYTVSAGQKYLCDAAPVSAEPVAPTESQIIEAAEKAGLWPNTVHNWIPQFLRYHQIIAAPVAAQAQPKKTALQRYKESGCSEEEPSTLERLRFFCSLAMSGDDWVDAGPLFDSVSATQQPVSGADGLLDAVRAEMIADTREVFDANGSEAQQSVLDVIEYVDSWLSVFTQKQADSRGEAAQPQPSGNAGELDELAAFEHELLKRIPNARLNRTHDGYLNEPYEFAWRMWQARAALAQQDDDNNDELFYKLGCFIDYATGGRLSKLNWPLATLKQSHDENLEALIDERMQEAKEDEQDADKVDAEHSYALKEGKRNAVSDDYFRARPNLLDNDATRSLFDDGFDRGYEAARKGDNQAQQNTDVPDWAYAGVTVFVGDKKVTKVTTRLELENSNVDKLLELFEGARFTIDAARKEQA